MALADRVFGRRMTFIRTRVHLILFGFPLGLVYGVMECTLIVLMESLKTLMLK